MKIILCIFLILYGTYISNPIIGSVGDVQFTDVSLKLRDPYAKPTQAFSLNEPSTDGIQRLSAEPRGSETESGNGRKSKSIVTGYNSVAWQTDSEPCISASGKDICAMFERGINVCATNNVPFGTKIKIDGLGTCEVWDRMSRKYPNRIDWFFGNDVQTAKNFGIKSKNILFL